MDAGSDEVSKGKPLIPYTIEAALASNLNKAIVSTDNEKIAKIARDYNAEVIMRPIELAQDKPKLYAWNGPAIVMM